MRWSLWIKSAVAGLVLTNSSVFANDLMMREQLQVPQCLATKITSDHVVLAENKNFQIIDLPAAEVDSLALLADKVACGRFINVSRKLSTFSLTAQKEQAQVLLQQPAKKPPFVSESYTIKHQAQVNAILNMVDSDNIWQTVTHLTEYYNRSAIKETGVDAAYWLKDRFEEMADNYGRTDTTTFFVKTGWYKQPSLVTVIGKDINAPGVVIGAHMDTLDGRMPGAGDDASGSASVMEMARVLLASNMPLKRPVYIIWYAAEERGLVGSEHVVAHFKDQNIPVKAAIQFDMTGYRVVSDDPTMWVFTDYVNKDLSRFVANLIETYVQVPVKYSKCGYGCSDHASWNQEGVPAAFPCETDFEQHNPYIHTVLDDLNLLNLDHMTNFTKLALAFAIELASE